MLDLDVYFPDKDERINIESYISDIEEEDSDKLMEISSNYIKSAENASLLIALELSNDHITEESSFFRRIWDFIISVIKKIILAISNFFKGMINFFKNMFANRKTDKIKQLEDLSAIRRAKIIDEIYDRIINNKYNITGSKNDIFSTEFSDNTKSLNIVRPRSENYYMNTVEKVYRDEFLTYFKNITISIDEISSLMVSSISYDNLIEKINKINKLSIDYKDKMYNITNILKDNKDSNIICINNDNCKDIIVYCISKDMKTRWNDVDIIKALDPKSCNRMLSNLVQSVRKIKVKSESHEQLKMLSSSLNSTISSTNLLFSEFFSCIRIHISSESIKFKILNLAIELMENGNK